MVIDTRALQPVKVSYVKFKLILTHSSDNLLAIGGCEVCDGSDFHSESELFDFETEQWTPTEAEFDWKILFAAPVVWSDGFYVFGGQTGLGQRDASDEIYRLGNKTWVEVGKLETARFGHGVVATEEGFHVFGGDRKRSKTSI